jgi:hypothetical protein
MYAFQTHTLSCVTEMALLTEGGSCSREIYIEFRRAWGRAPNRLALRRNHQSPEATKRNLLSSLRVKENGLA